MHILVPASGWLAPVWALDNVFFHSKAEKATKSFTTCKKSTELSHSFVSRSIQMPLIFGVWGTSRAERNHDCCPLPRPAGPHVHNRYGGGPISTPLSVFCPPAFHDGSPRRRLRDCESGGFCRYTSNKSRDVPEPRNWMCLSPYRSWPPDGTTESLLVFGTGATSVGRGVVKN